MNILISLVSDQTIPNVQFIKSRMDSVDRLLFVSTEKMENSGKRDWILNTVGIEEETREKPIVVNEYSFKDIEEKLAERINDEDHYIVNLTGGTKIMSLAVRDFFKDMDAEMYYLPGNNTEIKVHPGKNKTSHKLTARLSLDEYLNAYGFTVNKRSKPCYDFQTNTRILNYFLWNINDETDYEPLEYLRENRGKKNLSLLDEETIELKAFIDRLGIETKSPGKLDKYEIKSLSGEWLEDYLFQFIVQEFEIPEDSVSLGLEVEKNKKSPNEIDVLLMKNEKLYLFECKTSVFTEKNSRKTLIPSTIYKSDSLRKNFGLFAQTVIVTLSDLSGEDMRKHRERAEVSSVKLVDKADFTQDLRKALINV